MQGAGGGVGRVWFDESYKWDCCKFEIVLLDLSLVDLSSIKISYY